MDNEDLTLALDALIAVTAGAASSLAEAQRVSQMIQKARAEDRGFTDEERETLINRRKEAVSAWKEGL